MRWTDEEISILTEHYANVSMKELMEMLPGRSKASIYTKAFMLDLVREKKKSFDESARVCPECGGPKRNKSIRCYKCHFKAPRPPQKARSREVKKARPIRYRQWEKQILAELGPRVTMADLMMLLPRRSGVEIREMARQFGITLLSEKIDDNSKQSS